jgi:hypothetical protein
VRPLQSALRDSVLTTITALKLANYVVTDVA